MNRKGEHVFRLKADVARGCGRFALRRTGKNAGKTLSSSLSPRSPRRRRLELAVVFLAVATTGLGQTSPTPTPVEPATEPAVVAVEKVLPAVVNINTERVVRRQVRDPFDDFAAQFFGVYRNRPREIRQTLQSLGSGFLVDPSGYIVTNEHVVERAADLKIEVITNDNKSSKGRNITGDPKKDLALIKIDSDKPLPFVNLHDISPNRLGQTVIVVGNALGYGSSISRGVLSGVKREITINNNDYHDLLQIDAAINPGNSGGPLIDLSGRLVGISSAKMAFTPQGVPTQSRLRHSRRCRQGKCRTIQKDRREQPGPNRAQRRRKPGPPTRIACLDCSCRI